MQMPSIQSQTQSAEATHHLSPDTPAPATHIVIPDGWDLPSNDLAVAQQQYADALHTLERVSRVLNETNASIGRMVISPPKVTQMITVVMPLLHEMAVELSESMATFSSDCSTCRPTVSQELARALIAIETASEGATVASGEFAEWAWSILGSLYQSGDAEAIRIFRNLQATGVIGQEQ